LRRAMRAGVEVSGRGAIGRRAEVATEMALLATSERVIWEEAEDASDCSQRINKLAIDVPICAER